MCALREIELDIQGQCKDCIYVDIEEARLQLMKEARRKRLVAEEESYRKDC